MGWIKNLFNLGTAAASGFGLGTWATIIGVVALVSAGSATLVTARYYNHLIVTASTSAAQQSYDKAIAAQKKADAAMEQARVDDAYQRGKREQADADKSAIADAYLKSHRPPDIAMCRMPKDVAHAINGVLQ